jgi:hypothetical protein
MDIEYHRYRCHQQNCDRAKDIWCHETVLVQKTIQFRLLSKLRPGGGWFRRIPLPRDTVVRIQPACVRGSNDIWQCHQHGPTRDTDERREKRVLHQVLPTILGSESGNQL